MTIYLHQNDLPDTIKWGDSVAIDTEAMGLQFHRDRLCLVQLSFGDGDAHLIQIKQGVYDQSPNLVRLLSDTTILKLFHFARFDVGILYHTFGVLAQPLFCTKIASKLTRTYTDKHGLKDLCKSLLGVEISKHEQTSDWGAETLTEDQQKYAASDVLYLHDLKKKFEGLLLREKRVELAQSCFEFAPYRAQLDVLTGDEFDIFRH